MKKSERDAAHKAAEILKRHPGVTRRPGGEYVDGANSDGYGSGRLTKAQRKSQERHIPLTPAPRTTGQKIARKLWG